MLHLSTAFLIIALAIVVNKAGGATNQDGDPKADQLAQETKNNALTIVDGPKYVAPPTLPPATNYTHKPEQRPPSKPPLNLTPNLLTTNKYFDLTKSHYNQMTQKLPPLRHHYPQPPFKLRHPANSIFKYSKVIPPNLRSHYYTKPSNNRLAFAASTGNPVIQQKSPKFSLPVQTINGIRADFVRPPKFFVNSTTTSTTSPTTVPTTVTTHRPLRNKRIWPKRILEKMNSTLQNATSVNSTTIKPLNDSDILRTSGSRRTLRYVSPNRTEDVTTEQTPTPRVYRRVTRTPKIRSTTALITNYTQLEPNDWVPILPSHYPKKKKHSIRTKRSANISVNQIEPKQTSAERKRLLYLQSFGLLPVRNQADNPSHPYRKKILFHQRKLNPYLYSGYSAKPVKSPPEYVVEDLHTEASSPKVVTKIKHHHHHHHHRYVKTVEKKVPVKVEVPKPYPVTVEKKVPVEKIKYIDKPYPVTIKVPHPYPVKVIEKEYIPKPYPVIRHVPVLKRVEVKVPQPVAVPVEKRIPYPVEVKVPVPYDRPVPVPISVEKQVPYPVPVKVFVPQPYPVETKVPYPVQVTVKEPYEVIKQVPVKVPVPQPYPVKVPHPVPVPVEKKVPYPVEVEKKVPVPYEVIVPKTVEVEKKVPVYVPKPYPVEKKVPVPVKVPYPVKVPVKVPVEVPIFINHPYDIYTEEHIVGDGVTVTDNLVTSTPHHTVTVHGNSGFSGFSSQISRSDDGVDSTTIAVTTESP